MKQIQLEKSWELREESLTATRDHAPLIAAKTEGWMTIDSLPCDVHTPLVKYGKIEDPEIADNCVKCKWITKRSWWFRKQFNLDADTLNATVIELFIDILDVHADLFLNGSFVAHHPSAFYAFEKNVKPFLKVGENTLLIRLTTGLDRIVDEDVNPIRDFVACEYRTRREGRGEDRRVILRKPQHVFGWDQSEYIPTCAVGGEVFLRAINEVDIRDIRFETLALEGNKARILLETEIESTEHIFARELTAEITVEAPDGKTVFRKQEEWLGQPGSNYLHYEFEVTDPALWWPNGYGAQPLYTVRVKAVGMNGDTTEKELVTGIRTVRLDQSRLDATQRRYAFIVNGKRIYCKGFDFIQTDGIHSQITDEKQCRVLTAARDAGVNMLRFWDGNRYETDYVYSLCDKLGILVYQTFCFACGAYPDYNEEFLHWVEAEAVYQMKRLRSHPCLALWCGNGECLGLIHSYFGNNLFDREDPALIPGGTKIYDELLPRLHHQMVASVGYQACSPLGGFEEQETGLRGDMHYYPFLNVAPANQQFRISYDSYRDVSFKFVTESGVMGPPSAKALIRVCGSEEAADMKGPIFEHHRNTFEKNAVRDAVYRHYTGEKELTLDEYALFGGLFQGSLLSFGADSVRLGYECGGSLFWCLNDGLGEVGFSILDHFANPKPVYYFMKRAYHKNRLILRQNGDTVCVYAVNDRPESVSFRLECGYVSFEGNDWGIASFDVNAAPFAGVVKVGEFALKEAFDLKAGVVYAKADDPTVLPVTLCAVDFRELDLTQRAKLTVTDIVRTADSVRFTVTTDVFAHAVHFNFDENVYCSDQYFDLLPGKSRTIECYTDLDLLPETIVASSVVVKG